MTLTRGLGVPVTELLEWSAIRQVRLDVGRRIGFGRTISLGVIVIFRIACITSSSRMHEGEHDADTLSNGNTTPSRGWHRRGPGPSPPTLKRRSE